MLTSLITGYWSLITGHSPVSTFHFPLSTFAASAHHCATLRHGRHKCTTISQQSDVPHGAPPPAHILHHRPAATHHLRPIRGCHMTFDQLKPDRKSVV